MVDTVLVGCGRTGGQPRCGCGRQGDNPTTAVDTVVDPGIRRIWCPKSLVGLAVRALDMSYVTGDGDRPGRDPGASGEAGDRRPQMGPRAG